MERDTWKYIMALNGNINLCRTHLEKLEERIGNLEKSLSSESHRT